MMRRFGSGDLLQLPRLDSASAQTLGSAVLEMAKARVLPFAVMVAVDDLSLSHRALQDAAAQRLPAVADCDSARARSADRVLDSTWSALFDFLTGWSNLPEQAHADLGTRLMRQIFPEGPKFAQFAYKLEWAESNTRLRIIDDCKLELEQLGAGPILKRLREAHEAYGAALGVTPLTKASVVTAGLREALDTFAEALRHYVVSVAASVRRNEPKSEALAALLLAPIMEWRAPGAVARAADDGPDLPPA